MKLLLYCTKAKPYLYYAQESRTLMDIDNSFEGYKTTNKNVDDYINGKIVAECDFDVEEIKKVNYDCMMVTDTLDTDALLEKSCIDYFSLEEYLKPNWNKEDDLKNLDTVGYAIHIKNLHIFNRPLEINRWTVKSPKVVSDIICDSCINFGFNCKKCEDYWDYYPLEKAPQNMMYCYGDNGKRYVLISIRPEWLCKILNGEKTIEVRKKVLKEMLE